MVEFKLSFFGGQFYKDISFVKGDFERVSNIDTITPEVLGLNSSTFRDAKCFQKLGLKKYSAYRFELESACDRLDVIRNVGAQVIGIKATSGGLSDDPLFFLALYTISPDLYDNARSYMNSRRK